MKRITLFLLHFLFLMAMVHAQQVWTEGTQWEVEYNDGTPRTVFELISPVEIGGISYFPLIAKQSEQCDTLGFIRSERGDTLVYCRVYDIDDPYYLFDDFLLYDFSKSFEYGDTIRFGHVGFIKEELIDEEDGTLDYYYNVLEDGDILPSWNGLVYKLGYLEGPFGLFFSNLSSKYPPDPDSETGLKGLVLHPKPKNVSHTLFSTKKKRQSTFDLSNDIQRIEVRNGSKTFYTLEGISSPFLPTTIQRGKYMHYIFNGKKYMVLQNQSSHIPVNSP